MGVLLVEAAAASLDKPGLQSLAKVLGPQGLAVIKSAANRARQQREQDDAELAERLQALAAPQTAEAADEHREAEVRGLERLMRERSADRLGSAV